MDPFDHLLKRAKPKMFSEQKEHQLKCWPKFFKAVTSGKKKFEIRYDDRDFRERDILHLREWDPETKTYTGKFSFQRITYCLRGLPWVPDGYVAMSLKRVI